MKNKRGTITLSRFERVVTVFAESASGPGWANSPLWIVVQNGADGKIRIECLQPSEQSDDMHNLYAFSALAHGKMMKALHIEYK